MRQRQSRARRPVLNLRLAAFAGVLVMFSGPAFAERISNPFAVFNGLDKITGVTTTFEVKVGEEKQFGAMLVRADVCFTRPVTEEPKTTSFVQIDEVGTDKQRRRLFSGWMFAQSPGLNALEHPVYDVWLINCKDPNAPPAPVEEAPDITNLQDQIGEDEPLD
jgi:hypothetical protein